MSARVGGASLPTPGPAVGIAHPGADGGAPGSCDPLVIALGMHVIGCPICNAVGRAHCRAGRTLAQAAYRQETERVR